MSKDKKHPYLRAGAAR